jgi:cob(I)alamin adenosyltransferase
MTLEESPDQQKSETPTNAPDSDVSTSTPLRPGSTAEAGERRRAARANRVKKGLVIVNTGNGKGKTTAALGVLLRAWGRDMRVGGIQFLKHENANYGELRALQRMGVELTPMGDGFTWTSRDLDETQAKAVHGWETAKARIVSGQYDVFLLDEFTYVLTYGWVDTAEVIEWLRQHKPPMLHLIITGRNAPQALIDFADLVTEMREVKHPFRDQGIRAQKGIEY